MNQNTKRKHWISPWVVLIESGRGNYDLKRNLLLSNQSTVLLKLQSQRSFMRNSLLRGSDFLQRTRGFREGGSVPKSSYSKLAVIPSSSMFQRNSGWLKPKFWRGSGRKRPSNCSLWFQNVLVCVEMLRFQKTQNDGLSPTSSITKQEVNKFRDDLRQKLFNRSSLGSSAQETQPNVGKFLLRSRLESN